MKFKNILILLLGSILLQVSAEEIDTSKIVSNDSAAVILPEAKKKVYATAPAGDIAALFYKSKEAKEEKVKLLDEELNKKRKVVIIGNTVLAAALALEYGVILPASMNIDPNDTEDMSDRLALLSPQLLSLMMKAAGTTMTTMRTSESIDSYLSVTGAESYTNLSWKFYWVGWGATLLSSLVAILPSIPSMDGSEGPFSEYADELYAASFGISIAGDCIRIANGIYAMMMIKNIKGKARSIPVKITPSAGSGGKAGLSLNFKF